MLSRPALLTCKQIYQEANPILYSRNNFYAGNNDPVRNMIDFLNHVGTVNIGYIKTIEIFLPFGTKLSTALQLLRMLSENATRLWSMHFIWTVNFMRQPRAFVNALARIQGLGLLIISGDYVKSWPAYLQKSIGVEVRKEGAMTVFERGLERMKAMDTKSQIDCLRYVSEMIAPDRAR
ncbi:hypothetical protein GQ44DRAFT_825508 [Phaeosphaeriaceae sp. PMI808]|nr:hypothetical protein GQ44DRAFT_825508 [Phaeosphaeriaceae sp. PMI808]